jgi:AraC-like DNA-binding protein
MKDERWAKIPRLGYQPSSPYPLDLEIFLMSDLRQRATRRQIVATYQYAFHMLLCVTRGTCTQIVDFLPVPCKQGSLLALRPGQVHSFGGEDDWDGWIMLFRPEFLLASPAPAAELMVSVEFEKLQERMSLEDHDLRIVTDAVVRMREDAKMDASPAVLHALLRHQLYAVLWRLRVLHGRKEISSTASARGLQRFKDFRQLVEKHFATQHQVTSYARQLACSEKSLSRATMEVMGVSAKVFIASRVNLEAKRLLVHTASSITTIAERLGFDEATNFIKFFKREAGCTPTEFRRRQEHVRPS